MVTISVIADELTATGFRLAGAATVVPEPGGVAACLERALTRGGLVLVTAALAAELDPLELDRARRGGQPLVLVIPDAAGDSLPPDLGRAAERALGIAT